MYILYVSSFFSHPLRSLNFAHNTAKIISKPKTAGRGMVLTSGEALLLTYVPSTMILDQHNWKLLVVILIRTWTWGDLAKSEVNQWTVIVDHLYLQSTAVQNSVRVERRTFDLIVKLLKFQIGAMWFFFSHFLC